MDPKEKKILENTRCYLSLQYLLTQKHLTGEQPPKDLIMQTQKIGRLAGIPEDELNSL